MNPLESPGDDENIEGLSFTEEELIDALRDRTWDFATIKMLNQWTARMEAQFDQKGPRGQVEMEVKRAQLYSRANLIDIAKEAWNDAVLLATHFGDPALIALVHAPRMEAEHLLLRGLDPYFHPKN